MKKWKSITNKRLATLNAKSNQVGLDTSELLHVLERLFDGAKWKNEREMTKGEES